MTKRTAKAPRDYVPQVWVLFDSDGEFCGGYETEEEAFDDACGPRWYHGFTICKYDLVQTDTYDPTGKRLRRTQRKTRPAPKSQPG